MPPHPQPNWVIRPFRDQNAANPITDWAENDWLPRILCRCGATDADLEFCLLMGAKRTPGQAILNVRFKMRELPGREKIALRCGYFCGARVGPRADGASSNQQSFPPPALRLCSP